ncbi:hypothetical protein TEA_012026 [Camellia sinensis var. sinensis]|uniref:Uncharacterized protein n=1 Tax=Camellia sinensis var. sinensis TaxID=542762 RepID=A0A4S4DV85_CAMSN|nr:hypothetical protein TEA_012026 [Camellia sinensis var. sinensis]
MVEMKFLGIDFGCAFGSLSDGKFPDKDCLLPLISKLLGYCIVAASTTVKVPQILKILKHQSVRGLSVMAFELEVVGYTIALAYCLHKGLPFSAYGELAFLLIQEQKYRGAQLFNFFNEFCWFNGESFYQHTGKSSNKWYPYLLFMVNFDIIIIINVMLSIAVLYVEFCEPARLISKWTLIILIPKLSCWTSCFGLCNWYCNEWHHLESDNLIPEATAEERQEKRVGNEVGRLDLQSFASQRFKACSKWTQFLWLSMLEGTAALFFCSDLMGWLCYSYCSQKSLH